MAPEPSPIPPDLLDRYDLLIAAVPGVQRKGATMPYTSVNGHMFSYLDRGHLVLRLPAAERQAFIERHRTTLHEAHGIVQREYVDVPDELFADPELLLPSFRLSHAYVARLKPKPTQR
jgi:TfoX-like protein